jgi:hypothetical protein
VAADLFGPLFPLLGGFWRREGKIAIEVARLPQAAVGGEFSFGKNANRFWLVEIFFGLLGGAGRN